MTSKTKYIVIVLLLIVLATTSVGLSTWNIHYQAIVGNIGFTATEPGTQDSILNRYIYFTPTKDADGNITTDENDEVVSYDVHVEGVSEDNTVAIIVDLGAILPIGQNFGTVVLYGF